MERFLLYLDDLDDIVFALAFVGERLERVLRTLAGVILIAVAGGAASLVALHEPALGAASLVLAAVLILYRSATSPYTAFAQRN